MSKLVTDLIPYARRALRVFAYGAIPVVAIWLIDSDPVLLEAGIRIAASAALLALLDKRRLAGKV